METEAKKWFIHNGTQQLGPFSALEVQKQLTSGELQSGHFAWSEGMAQWVSISTIGELQPQDSKTATPPPLAPVGELSALIEISNLSPSEKKLETTGPIKIEKEVKKAIKSSKQAASVTGKSKSSFSRILAMLLITGVLALGAFILYDESTRNHLVSFINQFRSQLKPIAGLNTEEQNYLDSIASSKPSEVKVGLIVHDKTLYLASNQEDGTSFSLSIRGIPETLIDALYFNVKKNVTIKDHLATEEIGTIPLGEYDVEISPGGFHQKLFLGGQKDANYTQKLALFHDATILKIKQELTLMTSVLKTLQDSFTRNSKLYDVISSEKSVQRIIDSEKRVTQNWIETQQELSKTIGDWNLDSLKQSLRLWKTAQRLLLLKQLAIQTSQKAKEISLSAPKNPSETLTLRAELKTLLHTRDQATQELDALLKTTEEKLNAGQWIPLLETE